MALATEATLVNLTRDSRGFVVRGRFVIPGKNGAPDHEHHSWWYGPDHGWATTWGRLDYSVHVFATRTSARAALREAGIGRASRHPVVMAVQDAVAFEIDHAKERRAAAVAEGRTDRAIDWTKEIARLRDLERKAS